MGSGGGGADCEFLNLQPLTQTVMQMLSWKKWERNPSQKAEQGCVIIVCVHQLNDITGDACSDGVLVFVWRQNNIQESADHRDFICWLWNVINDQKAQ